VFLQQSSTESVHCAVS